MFANYFIQVCVLHYGFLPKEVKVLVFQYAGSINLALRLLKNADPTT